MIVTANVSLIEDLFRAVEERNLSRLLEIYAPDVEFIWPPSLTGYGGTYQGNAVLGMHSAFASAWDPVQQSDELRCLDPKDCWLKR
jgi:ketosteroid isomerase-like protein